MPELTPLTTAQLEAGLDVIRRSPADNGSLDLIVRRPNVGQRQVLDEAVLDLVSGLIGDNWSTRGSSRTDDGSAHPDMQLNLMNVRAIALLAQAKERWPLAGDQLFVDIDLGQANMPPGTQLAIGSAIISVTAQPHTGCKKFAERFGTDAVRFVNSDVGKELRLRGINARVVKTGRIRVGDLVSKIEPV